MIQFNSETYLGALQAFACLNVAHVGEICVEKRMCDVCRVYGWRYLCGVRACAGTLDPVQLSVTERTS